MSMLQVEDLSVRYGPVEALSSVRLHVEQGEIVALLGSNGAGKSTLMRTIVGLAEATSGSVTFENDVLTGLPIDTRVRRGIATVLEGRGILPSMSVLENLQMGAFVRGNEPIQADLDAVFGRFPVLQQRQHQAAGTLSGGEQQMLAIGRALMQRPRLILMDEPSMGLAPVIVEKVFDTIQEINRSGTTVLLVEQNARMALSIANRFYVLRVGEIVLQGHMKGDSIMADQGGGKFVAIAEDDLEAAYLEGHYEKSKSSKSLGGEHAQARQHV
jgi:branched-chain amino acid transport system ATP-binding protein